MRIMKNLLLTLLVLVSIAFFSCNKEETSILSSEDEAILSNDAAAEAVIEVSDYEVELFSGSNESIDMSGGNLKSANEWPFAIRYRFGLPPVITVDPADGTFPITITLNYGEGVELVSGNTISGKIIIVLSAPPRTNGATRTVTFDNFYVDSVNIAGSRTWTFTAKETGGGIVNVIGSTVITFADGTTINRELEKTREFISGYDTPFLFSDDRFQITGFTNSVSSEGYTFSAVIQEPLIRTGECRFIVEGTVVFSNNDEQIAILDYGDGSCDDIASITKNGEERQITLGKRHKIRNN